LRSCSRKANFLESEKKTTSEQNGGETQERSSCLRPLGGRAQPQPSGPGEASVSLQRDVPEGSVKPCGCAEARATSLPSQAQQPGQGKEQPLLSPPPHLRRNLRTRVAAVRLQRGGSARRHAARLLQGDSSRDSLFSWLSGRRKTEKVQSCPLCCGKLRRCAFLHYLMKNNVTKWCKTGSRPLIK